MSSKRKRHRSDRRKPRRRERPAPGAAPRNPRLRNAGRSRNTGLWAVGAVVVLAGILLYALNKTRTPQANSPGSSATSNAPSLAATTSAPAPVTPEPSPPPPPEPAPAPANNQATPLAATGARIKFAEPVHDFGQVKAGEVVPFSYIFTNIGTGLLEVSNVKPGCGCTTAGEWTHQVEPGKTGTIPIKFNSQNFSGHVAKSVTVTCNDSNQPTVRLQITGNVWRPIEVTPRYALINLTDEAPSNATTVKIVSHLEEPVYLSELTSPNPAFAVELQTNQPGKEYQLLVKTAPPWPTNAVNGVITLKTTATNMPTISVTAMANRRPAVMVTPSRLRLPPGPLSQATTQTLWIRRSYGTNALVLSEPKVNAPGVTVQLKESQAGRLYSVALGFPAGFALAPNQALEFSVRSNHPKFPVLKAPITQMPRTTPMRFASPVRPTPPGKKP